MLKNIKLSAIYSLLLVYVSVDAADPDTITPASNNTPSLKTDLLNLQMKVLQSKLTEALQGKLPKVALQSEHEKLMVIPKSVPSTMEYELDFRKMCQANRDNDTYKQMFMENTDIWKCFEDILLISSKLPSQIEEAKPKGNLDEVFEEYCSHLDEFKGCLYKSLVDVIPCLTDDQKLSVKTMQNITDKILKFSCQSGGDHLALFTAEKGPQCISSKQPGIVQCIKKNINMSKTDKILYEMLDPRQNFTEPNLVVEDYEKPFSFVFDLEQCRTAYKIRTCIVEEVRTCPSTTPVNVVESIFDNLILKLTTCAKYSRSELDPTYNSAAASSMFTSIFSVVILVVIILVVLAFIP